MTDEPPYDFVDKNADPSLEEDDNAWFRKVFRRVFR